MVFSICRVVRPSLQSILEHFHHPRKKPNAHQPSPPGSPFPLVSGIHHFFLSVRVCLFRALPGSGTLQCVETRLSFKRTGRADGRLGIRNPLGLVQGGQGEEGAPGPSRGVG